MSSKTSSFKSYTHTLVVSGLLLAASSPTASAIDGEWSGNEGSNLWSEASNWNAYLPGGINNPYNGDKAIFGTSVGGLIQIDSQRSIRDVVFSSTAGSFNLGAFGPNQGEVLNLTHAGEITLAQGSTVTQTIDAALLLHAQDIDKAGIYTFANRTLAVDSSSTGVSTSASTPKLNFKGNISGGQTNLGITLKLAGTVGTRNANNSTPAQNQPAQQANTISGIISDGGAQQGLSIEVNGTASGNSNRINAWNLTGLNTYSGSTNVVTGALYFDTLRNKGEASALGTGLNGDIYVGSFLMYTGGVTSTDRTIRGTGGSFHNHGTGAMTLNGDVLTTGGITFRGQHSFIINGLVSGNSNLSNNGGSLRTILANNNNSFSGDVAIYDGTLVVGTIKNAGEVSAIGSGSTIVLGQDSTTVGRLEYTGTGDVTDKNIRLQNGAAASSGNGRILNEGTGTLQLNGWIRTSNANATYASHLEMSGSSHVIVGGSIGGTAASASTRTNTRLTKTGASTWEITKDSLISGAVAINAGTLLVTNSSGSATGTGSVTTSGTATLGGTGSVTGSAGASITIATNTHLMVGNTHGTAIGVYSNDYAGSASTLRLGGNFDVALNLKGKILFDIFSNDAGITLSESDRLYLQTTASSIDLNGAVITVATPTTSSGWSSGSWQLVDWSGIGSATKNGNVTYNLDSTALAGGYTWDTSNFLSNGTISIEQYAYFWKGESGGVTDWGNAGNWSSSGLPPDGSEGYGPTVRDVYFGAVASGASTTGTWTQDRRVENIYFTDPNTNYVQGGSNTLYTFGHTLEVAGGTQTLRATLRLRGSNPVFTINNHGTLNLDSGFMFSNADPGKPSTRTLVFGGTGNINISQITNRAGGEILHLQQNSTGITTISGFSTVDPSTVNSAGAFLGKTSILQGTLRIRDERALGRVYATHQADHLTINGGTLGAYGTFAFNEKNRGITIGDQGGTLNIEGSYVLSVNTQMVGSGTLTKTGTGTLEMKESQNAWAQSISVQQGVLRLSNTTGSATGVASITVHSGATLSGDGSLSGGPASSITLGAGSALVVGNHHRGEALKSDLLLGDLSNPNALQVSIQGMMKFDIFGEGLLAEVGDASYLDFDAISNDQLIIGSLGQINLSNSIIDLASFDTSNWQEGQTWKLIDWSQATPALVTTSGIQLLESSIGGFQLEHLVASDGLYVRVVPEPRQALLLLCGLGSFVLRRRK